MGSASRLEPLDKPPIYPLSFNEDIKIISTQWLSGSGFMIFFLKSAIKMGISNVLR